MDDGGEPSRSVTLPANADDLWHEEQSIEERRRLQRQFRSLLKQTTTEQNKFLDAKADVLHEVLSESDALLQQTRQTTEAAIDAALVIRISELAYKRTANFLADRTDDTGINLEDFVSRCRDYMRFGRGIADPRSPALSRAQRRRRRIERRQGQGQGQSQNQSQSQSQDGGASQARGRVSDTESEEDDDEVDDDGDDNDRDPARSGDSHPDWTHFGQYACLPRLRRPGLARFLPRAALAGDDRARVVVRKRMAALRLHELEEVRPQVLRPGDLSTSQNSDLTALATDILQQLQRAAEHGQAKVQRAYDEAGGGGGDEDDADDNALLQRLMNRYGIRSDGGVDLIRFAVNPQSFSQTVENFFYISFLVRDGRVGLAYDDNGLPSIYPITEEEAEAAKDGNEQDTRKHQLILSLDMALWRDMIQTFNIKKSMIAHRQTATEKHPDGRAWFS